MGVPSSMVSMVGYELGKLRGLEERLTHVVDRLNWLSVPLHKGLLEKLPNGSLCVVSDLAHVELDRLFAVSSQERKTDQLAALTWR